MELILRVGSDMNLRKSLAAMISLACACMATPAATWVDWSAADSSSTIEFNTVTGRMSNIEVIYRGPTYFVQLDGGTDFWTQGVPPAYSVTGRPRGSDLIAISGGTGNLPYTLTFSQPVRDPYFAIVSLGNPDLSVEYRFEQTPTLVSSGRGYWGGCADCLRVDGNTVIGVEGHGVLRFQGSFTELRWTAPTTEFWYGFTVGMIPEPSSMALMVAGGLVVSGVVRRRRTMYA